MRIRRLKLSGFKSFVEPSELRIEPGLTGVVGPNGCGKSNLLEAIRWVMGESSPKSMRSGGMDDVIFAGTATRPARDFAEVVLTADAAIGDGPVGELEVVRRIERGAGSAYRINGRDVRAKDIALIFADAATGAHSPALVSQGRIAAVIAAKPAERRQMLEEAAGIAGLHVRRREAEQKLRATETNLARLDDMLAGLESQIGSLRRQARAAERYRDLSERLRHAEARLVFARWRDAAEAADTARAEEARAEADVAARQQTTTTAQSAQAAAAHALADAREILADRRQDAAAQSHRLAALSAQLESAEQRLVDLDRQLARLEDDHRQADRLTRDAAEAIAALERDAATAESAKADLIAQQPARQNAEERAERDSRAAELALAHAMAAQAGVEAEWRIAEAALVAAKGRLERLNAEHARRDAQRRALDAESAGEAEVEAARSARDAASAALAEARTALAALSSARDPLIAGREQASEALAVCRADRAAVSAEHAALTRDQAARQPRAGGKAAISAVSAAPGYERALAAVLGRDADAVLGAAPEGQDGRFWTGAAVPQPPLDSLRTHVPRAPDELAARLALTRFAERDEGQELAPGEWLVTRDGALRRWDGYVARGEGAAEAAVLAGANRLAELDAKLPDLASAEAEAEEALKAAQSALTAHATQLAQAERTVAERAEVERRALRAFDQAEDAMARAAARQQEIAATLAELDGQRVQAEAELRAADEKRAALPDPATGRARVEEARQANDTARRALQAAMAERAALDQALALARERGAAQAAEIRSWQARAGDAAKRLADMAGRRDELTGERAACAAKPEGLHREIAQADAIRTRLADELAIAERTMADTEAAARLADAALAAATEALGAAREQRAGAVARAESQVGRREEAARQSGERFACPPPLLPGKFAFDAATVRDAEAEQAKIASLTAERERLGPVNLVAADELAEAEARFGSSQGDKEELLEAVNRLRGSIGNLNREGRERLRAAFDAVDGHFRQLFSRLFQGGAAHLALVDSDDPLEAGLEIFAQPPGKRLQSLTLLSGGEQALTAVALIFALFLTNPAPICVLDEVDAPLDDANIERFCDLLDEMVGRTDTRYLIVTHNAVTMSRMHRLFGVTMVEQGISRLVSVDLGGAEQLLAAE